MTLALKVEQVSRRFGGLLALDSVNIEVEAGTIHAIIGPNGAGKTTLFNIIAGAFPPTTGRVLLADREITGIAPERLCALGIARTFQIPRPFAGLTVLDNIAVGYLASCRNVAEARERAGGIVEFLGMQDHAAKLARSLTIGLRKRLEVARALSTDPKLLLLDEVMGGLHGNEVDQMIELVRRIGERGVTVVLIEHVMPVIMSLPQRVTVLDQGRVIASGTPDEVTQNPVVIAAYLGDEVAA